MAAFFHIEKVFWQKCHAGWTNSMQNVEHAGSKSKQNSSVEKQKHWKKAWTLDKTKQI